jgi:hypothetical protein
MNAITSLEQVTEFPLTWPPSKPRSAKRRSAAFKSSFSKAEQHLTDQMRRAGFTPFVLSRAVKAYGRDLDPAVALWFYAKPRAGGAPRELRVLACDTFMMPEDNVRAIGLTVEALRKMEGYGTYTVEQAMEGARPALPPPAGLQVMLDWWVALGLPKGLPLAAYEGMYRDLSKQAAGNDTVQTKLNLAIEAARKELGNG